MPATPQQTVGTTRRRRIPFIIVSVVVSLCLAVVAAEMALRIQAAYNPGEESMTQGLIEYDRNFGWTLQPNWKGNHKHPDYLVRYRVASDGFRGPWPENDQVSGEQPGECIALVGDSFTFGLGVNEEDTFAHRLEIRGVSSQRTVLNLGVPGYSTDQEVLLLEKVIQQTKVKIDHVILVVCLINDVFDNDRVYPLQAMHGKPRFRLQPDGTLILENVPVPASQKPESEMKENLASLVKPGTSRRQGGLIAWLGRQEISRRLGFWQPSFEAPNGFYRDRFADPLKLFEALVQRAHRVTTDYGARFTLALLPGRSFVEDPTGYSARYQEYLRDSMLQSCKRTGISVVDLASPLIESQAADEGPFFHPNDGHLNATGHAKVAELLQKLSLTGTSDE